MTNLFTDETILGYFSQLVNLLSVFSIFFGINIIVTKNPIISVLYLIMLFSTISVYLIYLGAVFIGLSYLLVYVGAVSILFIFILMLINIRVSELVSQSNNHIFFGFLVLILIIDSLHHILPTRPSWEEIESFHLMIYNNVSYVTSISWDGSVFGVTDIETIGHTLYSDYSFWLIISSIILLLAMVGAIIVTIKKKDV